MILIISTGGDEHTVAVLNELNKLGLDVRVVDLSKFPQHMRLSMYYEQAGRCQYRLGDEDKDSIALESCSTIWWRRPQHFVLSPNIVKETHRIFALNECHEAFTGLWQGLDVFWVNHPSRDDVAHRKSYQLRIAQEVGLSIPRTLISNNPQDVKEFVTRQGYGRTIYKAFSATEQEWRETRILRQEELDLLDNVQYAPVIFQEYIEASCDLRITVIGNNIFPAAIYSQETAYKVDFRMDMFNARIEPITLPTALEDQLHNLMTRLGLSYGAIDMRLTPDGKYVFLEINPAGQWLFVERQTLQPIAACLARLLSTRNK